MRKFTRQIAILACCLIPLTASASEWNWTTSPTPGSLNEFTAQTEENNSDEPSYQNGTLSDQIILSEVMPNPEGTDNDTEWIEIYNASTTNVNLGNWSLDDEDGGSDPYIFPAGTIIEAQDFLVIYRSESDISLNNDADEVRLFDFENTLQDNVSYDRAPEGESYARISLDLPSDELALARSSFWSGLIPVANAAWHEGDWQWTKDVTRGSTNPIYESIAGEITDTLPFDNKIELQQKNGKKIAVSLAKINLNPELKESTFNIGNQIEGYVLKKANGLLELKEFTANTSPTPMTTEKSSTLPYLLLMIASIVGLFIYRTSQKYKSILD